MKVYCGACKTPMRKLPDVIATDGTKRAWYVCDADEAVHPVRSVFVVLEEEKEPTR